MATKAAKAEAITKIVITPPNFKSVRLRIEGTAPLMTHKFSEKMRKKMEAAQTAVDKTKAKREPKNYDAEFNAARYVSTRGWDGIPAGAIRAAMIAACRYVQGLTMTLAKGAFFIKAHGQDEESGTPLVEIIGKAEHDTRPVRNDGGGTDLRNRPIYKNWAAEFEIEFDADLITVDDVANLLARAGAQVGLCELRPQSKKGPGGDYGTFRVVSPKRRK